MNLLLEHARKPEGAIGMLMAESMAATHAPYYAAIGRELRGRGVLEVGCGDAAHAACINADYVGVDHSETLIDAARRRLPRFRFICGDVAEVALPAVDDAFAVNVIQWLARPIAALISVRGALRKGGRFIIGSPDPACPRRPHVRGASLYSATQLAALMTAAGFQEVTCRAAEMPALRYLIVGGVV